MFRPLEAEAEEDIDPDDGEGVTPEEEAANIKMLVREASSAMGSPKVTGAHTYELRV